MKFQTVTPYTFLVMLRRKWVNENNDCQLDYCMFSFLKQLPTRTFITVAYQLKGTYIYSKTVCALIFFRL